MATPVRKRFELKGADGEALRGDIRTAGDGRGRPAVVICHGFKGFKDWGFFPHLAKRIARAGMTAVSFNFSASGVGPDGDSFSEPERFRNWTLSGDLADLDTVVTAVANGAAVSGVGPPSAIGLVGHSRGGGIAVLFAGGDDRVRALVTWNAIANPLRWGPETIARWRETGELRVENQRTGEVLPLGTDLLDDIDRHGDRLDIVAAAADVTVPWLIVHGAADATVPLPEGRQLHAAAPGAELLVIEGGSHTFGAKHPWAGTTDELERAMEATVEWMGRGLFQGGQGGRGGQGGERRDGTAPP